MFQNTTDLNVWKVRNLSKHDFEPQHGAITEPYIAMTYVLYLIRAMGGHATRAQIDHVTAMAGRLNYFVATSALASLIRTMHIDECELPEKEVRYAITSLGFECLDSLIEDLNPEIRKRIDKAVEEYTAK